MQKEDGQLVIPFSQGNEFCVFNPQNQLIQSVYLHSMNGLQLG
jgi:hypothetical protein